MVKGFVGESAGLRGEQENTRPCSYGSACVELLRRLAPRARRALVGIRLSIPPRPPKTAGQIAGGSKGTPESGEHHAAYISACSTHVGLQLEKGWTEHLLVNSIFDDTVISHNQP